MGTSTLNNRTNGETIDESFFNEIHAALNTDFVGRSATGVATSGKNLGTATIPWGTLWANSAVINGSAIDLSQIQAPQNRIISGSKQNSGASAGVPNYIRGIGSTTVIVDGSITPLIYDVNGTIYTLNAARTKTSLTPAPSSQNTALVNMNTSGVPTQLIRTWGETGGFFDYIAIDTAGTEITDRIGTTQSFKITNGGNTEYFTAFIESATKLTKVQRGFFFTEPVAPIKRISFADNDTITLMSTAWVFVSVNTITVDVTYNEPIYSFTAPSSPVLGDYWYDIANDTWKIYNGSSFAIVNETLVGMVILDDTEIVGLRSQDFFAKFDSENTVKLVVKSGSTTTVETSSRGQKVNVMGNTIEFQSIQSWTINSSFALSSQMYSTTPTTARYFCYVKSTGATVLSDIEPQYRGDLCGWYNPHFPWRCVGFIMNITPTNVVYVVNIDDYFKVNVQAYGAPADSFASATATTVRFANGATLTADQYAVPFSAIYEDSGVFTAPFRGKYRVNTAFYGTVGSGAHVLNVRKNATNVLQIVVPIDAGAQRSLTLSGIVYCEPGDQIDVQYVQNSGSPYTGDTSALRQFLDIEKINDSF